MQPTSSPPVPVNAASRKAIALMAGAVIVASLLFGLAVRLVPGTAGSSPSTIASVPSASPPSASGSGAAAESLIPTAAASATVPTTPLSSGPTTSVALPVKGSAYGLGTDIEMASGPDGGVYVAIPTRTGSILVLLDAHGKPRTGWPIAVPDVEPCSGLYAAADGSVRLRCRLLPVGDAMDATSDRVFGFDSTGRQMPGWPVDTEIAVAGRMIDGALWLMVEPPVAEGATTGSVAMVRVDADGSVDHGQPTTQPSGGDDWAIGPDAIGYRSRHYDWSGTTPGDVTSDVTAFDLTGQRSGWPVTIDGNASKVAFYESGIQLIVGPLGSRPTQRMIIGKEGMNGPDGPSGSDGIKDMPIVSSSTYQGAGDSIPGPPIVGSNGDAYIVDTEDGHTKILAVTPDGPAVAGWPYTSSTGIGWTGFCGDGDTGCGHPRTIPEMGGNGDLYVIHAPASRSTGGSIVAIAPDARVRAGWPVGLKRAGAMFWSLATDPQGGVWALAVEPEGGDTASATILSIAEDSTVRWTSTILGP